MTFSAIPWSSTVTALLQRTMQRNLKQNQNEGKISAFLTIENGSLIDGKMDKIREIYDLGVRLVTLTWNDDNCLGHCHSKSRRR